MKTKTLTVEQVVMLHETLLEATGGAPGMRDRGAIEAALARPFSGFGGYELFPTLEEKAAALAHSLAKGHPFVDGNKRVAITAAGVFLMLNGYRLVATQDELEAVTLDVAEGVIDVPELAKWIRRHLKPIRRDM